MIALWTRIDDCGLSRRARNALVNEGYTAIGEVVEMIRRDRWSPLACILRLPNVGRLTATEIMRVVEPLLSQLQPEDGEFIDWCRRNRMILESLRRNWYDFEDDHQRKDSTDETRHTA